MHYPAPFAHPHRQVAQVRGPHQARFWHDGMKVRERFVRANLGSPINLPPLVILSAAASSRSKLAAESKDPYSRMVAQVPRVVLRANLG